MAYGIRKIRNKEQWKIFDKTTKDEYTTHNSLAEAKARVAQLEEIDRAPAVVALPKKEQNVEMKVVEKKARCPKGTKRYAPVGDECYTQEYIDEWQRTKGRKGKKEEPKKVEPPKPQLTLEERISKLPPDLSYLTADFVGVDKAKLKKGLQMWGKVADILFELGVSSIGHIRDYYYDTDRYDIEDVSEASQKYRQLFDDLERVWNTYYKGEDWKTPNVLSNKERWNFSDFNVEENENYGQGDEDNYDDYEAQFYVNDWDDFFEVIQDLNEGISNVRDRFKEILKPQKSKLQNFRIEVDDSKGYGKSQYQRLREWLRKNEWFYWEGERYTYGGIMKATEEGRVINSDSEIYPLSKYLADRNYITLKRTNEPVWSDRGEESDEEEDEDEDMEGEGLSKACWKGYEAVGMKKKGKRMVPNCVPIKGGRITIGEWTYIPFRQEMMGVGVGSSTAKIAPTSPDELTRLVYANRPPLVLRPARREPYQDPKAIQSAKFEMAMRKLKRDFNR